MPLVVTAGDISAALIKTDATVTALDGTVQANRARMDPSVVRSWEVYRDGYRTFSTANRDLSWYTLGLPAIGDQVLAYERELAGWQSLIDAATGVVTAPPTVPQDTVNETGTQTLPTLDGSTKVLIGAGLALALLLLLKK